MLALNAFFSAFSSKLSLFPLLAQQGFEDPSADLGPLLFVYYAVAIVLYAVLSFFAQKIYQKCGAENAWFAWIPILNYYVHFQVAEQENPLLWTLLSVVPCVNIVAAIFYIIGWVNICKKLGKSPLLLLICLIPCAAIFVMGYLAFG